ncbi:MAG: transposase, partial [Cyanobacteria bacterium]|nr:transposase [Cyanobacteriota bacterium]
WLTVLTELKNRGVEDIFIACCDGLTGFPDAYAFGGAKLYETLFPKTIYTTNAIESMNMTLRKVLRNHRTFPTDESAMKVFFLALQNISQKWTMPIRDWKSALNRFAIEFEGRMPD